MSNDLIESIISEDQNCRNRSIHQLLENKKRENLLVLASELDLFRRSSQNLYHKVRASLFLSVIYRFYLARDRGTKQYGTIPFEGVKAASNRDFETAIDIYLKNGNHDSAVCSALADCYYKIAYSRLLDQVKLSISQSKENYHLFNISGLADYPYSVPGELTSPDRETGQYPVGMDASPVRLDPSHSCWSDIFFLGMDFPEGARVINLSVDLRVNGSSDPVLPPCECYSRFIEEPVIHLISADLGASKKVASLEDLFNFGNDHLSLLKAGIVASGIVPPCFEHKGIPLQDILSRLLGRPGGIEIVTKVNSIPRGSRLAVSTALLSTVIARLMRFSSQIKNQTGGLQEEERRIVASRSILGEWLGGSGGGWQDSGGLWPGTKKITGKFAEPGDPEFGISRGCLLPVHSVFAEDEISSDVEHRILDSMVIVHGGISWNVGPVLEMVTEKYLLRYEKEWAARKKSIALFDDIVEALKAGDMKELGRLTTRDWDEAIQEIIPGVNNAFTEDLINRIKEKFSEDYWGFLMLGGMSGGGMAFLVAPDVRDAFKDRVREIMLKLKSIYRSSLPFIIDPLVYDFKINHEGIRAVLLKGDAAASVSRIRPLFSEQTGDQVLRDDCDEDTIKNKYGFDMRSHEHMKAMLKSGIIGLGNNRLPRGTDVHDIAYDDILHADQLVVSTQSTDGSSRGGKDESAFYNVGIDSLMKNEAAVLTFAGGMGSRWSEGAAVVKPISPFIKIEGKFRTFMECHIAKSRKTGHLSGCRIPHIFTTSYLTHDAITEHLERTRYFNYKGKIYLSPAKSIGHRVYPMERDLIFFWEEQLSQKKDTHVQKVQDNVHRAMIERVKEKGEGEDYDEGSHILRFNPPGHWFEIPNLLKNGVLAAMIRDNRNLKYLLCHNIDTLGASLDPLLLGMHIAGGSTLTFEVTPRRIEDAGGGLARINGHLRLVEAMALPYEEDEFRLSYYNTLTNWISIDNLLKFFGLNRGLILEADRNAEMQNKIAEAVYNREKTIPAYVTIKNVRHLWGSGQEDHYPVAQFEKLWGDMTGLKDLKVSYVSVPRHRGLQLKEPSLLDMWVNDGSLEYFRSISLFDKGFNYHEE